MALIVSEQMQQRKKLKFQRELKRQLSSFTSDQLKTNIQKMFKPSVTKPSADAFYNMMLASKFGTGNAINNGGQCFILESCVSAYNHSIENKIGYSQSDNVVCLSDDTLKEAWSPLGLTQWSKTHPKINRPTIGVKPKRISFNQ